MLPAILTTLLFSCSAICAGRSARIIGGGPANLVRMLVAAVLLGICAHTVGRAFLGGPALRWFIFSGFIGFGFGDVAMFGAIQRIGPRLTMLLTHCVGAVLAAATEWCWLGTRLGFAQIVCALIILGGVALALAPDHGAKIPRGVFWSGVLWGLGSAAGQGFGSVISRKASAFYPATHGITEGIIGGATAAYERLLPGILVALAFFLLTRRADESREPGAWPRAWPWIIGNALAGPSIGVAVFQWGVATTPTGILMPIVATVPVITQFLAWKIEGHHPTRRTVLGGIIAVAGVIALAAASGKLNFLRE
jgi:drug/metabolite transporter (DMT)-like permease